jgi:mRNA-degrading endonuclease RelE of RelBE toxin-antitoxin system
LYDIDWKPKAIKQLSKIGDKADKLAIRDAVGELAAFPDYGGAKWLTNHRYGYRLRVGRYRIMFDVNEALKIIDIQEVKKRDERTY